MRIDLRERSALVTGSTAGIGYATTLGLAESGARVIVNGREPDRVHEAAKTLREATGNDEVTGITADLGTAEGCARAIEEAPDVDVLVNNAGVFGPQPFAQIPDEEWQRFFDVNVMSGVRLARHHVPRMVARGWGRVVFVSSESAQQIPAEMVHYGATKTAQVGIAESYPASGVTVNSVLPGPTRSEGIQAFMGSLAEQQGVSLEQFEADFIANERPASVIRRLSTPEEVAAMIMFVCSEQASSVTGSALRVDGGVDRSVF
ncbi:SDR family oxidoreductase [Egibacter rhizosphaerae]|uniref:SDR family oxidoreductase n=1 Tax=Egibacter rhizosphaerae TaxID=1670831 RepID=A0A411YFG6_9ACTN|nr:SDR family oxidoreductase [Egibacter rhizosphaerae]QBI19926.1 SDR family oxidoreductase [Egibacter rhizosphaerae]